MFYFLFTPIDRRRLDTRQRGVEGIMISFVRGSSRKKKKRKAISIWYLQVVNRSVKPLKFETFSFFVFLGTRAPFALFSVPLFSGVRKGFSRYSSKGSRRASVDKAGEALVYLLGLGGGGYARGVIFLGSPRT